jgi:NAD(P)-dependent dehydrogenase (short-subunit alcohol dehydrogenase family)
MENIQVRIEVVMSGNDRRVAIVTGAGGGLGGATARLLAEDGIQLALLDVRQEPLEGLAAAIRGEGGVALTLAADLQEAGACEDAVAATIAEFGRVDILVNSAAILDRHDLEEFTEEHFLQTFRTNAAAPFFLTRAAMRDMVTRHWGRVVNVTSTGVYEGGFTMTSSLYEASKGAVAVLTKMFAKYGAAHGVLVNSLCPGGMRTRMLLEQTPGELIERAERELIPLGRLAEPDEMAAMIRWLVSDENSYATGAEFDVTGGLAIH